MRRFLPIAIAPVLLASAAAHAEVLAVCQKPETSHAAQHAALPLAVIAAPEASGDIGAAPLALSRDAKGFDVVLNWGLRNQQSLRAGGAEIMGNDMGEGLIHLMVVRRGTPSLEHFLFSLNDDAPGELVWQETGDAAGGNSGAEMSCIKPKS